jgi:CHAD domain-containing protein
MSEVEPAIVSGESRPGPDSPIVESPFVSAAVPPMPSGDESDSAAIEQEAEQPGDETSSSVVAAVDDRQEITAEAPEPARTLQASSSESPPVKSLKSIIEAELTSLKHHHRRVLDSGEVEAIHKMRVVTRKLQAAIDLLQFKPDQLKIKGLKRTLRRWRRSLSPVRNYDVFLAIVEKETLARKPGGRRPYELIGKELEERRVVTLHKARSELKQIKIDDLAAKLGLAFEHGAQPASPEGAPGLIDDEAKIAARAFDRLRQRLAEFQARALSTHATDKPAHVHQLRIAAKRLRYLIEALSQMGYGDATRAVEWLKAIQDRLGDLHDIEAFGEEIVRVTARPRFVRKHMAEAGEILQAGSRFLARREGMRARLLPLRVPAVLGAASSRLTRSVSASSASATHATARPVASPPPESANP